MVQDPRAKAQERVFQGYAAHVKVLIADPSSSARSSISNILLMMGLKLGQIVKVSDFSEAETHVEKLKPEIIIADYNLGKHCGLDLLRKLRELRPDGSRDLFFLVTANISQTAVARAVEDDVDAYIIKPFTVAVVRNSIVRAVLKKIDPSEYLKTIAEGRKQLEAGQTETALMTFERSKQFDPSPALACYYIGRAKDQMRAYTAAGQDYLSGLDFNKIHYKCLVGLHENFLAREKNFEAYEVLKKLSHYFPPTPERLISLLRLSVQTRSFEDVERYYQIFTGIEERSEEMIRTVCAALVVCGKHYLQQNLGSRALELFEKAAETASGRTKILREIITALVESGLTGSTGGYLSRFPPETRNGADYQALELLIQNTGNAAGPDPVLIERARTLLREEIHDPIIYKVLIHHLRASGQQTEAEKILREAHRRFPQQKPYFQS